MNKTIKILCCLLAAVMLLPVFAACNVNNGGDATDPTTLRVAVDVTKTEVNIIEKLIEGFTAKEENKDIKIKVVKISQGYDSYVQKNFGKTTMADIISVYDYNSEYWTSMNLLRPVTEYMKRDGINEADYVQSMMALGKSGGDGDDNYYWLPRDYNKVVVCYNTEMFRIAGIGKPSDDWTMEDFENVCKQLIAKRSDILASTRKYDFWPVEMNARWTAVYYPYIKSYGGDFLASDGSLFNDTAVVKTAINKLLNYADQTSGKQTYKGLGYANPIGQSNDANVFVNKQAAMSFTVRPNVKSFADALDNNIDFVSLPRITDNDGKTSCIGAGCSGYGITSGCSDLKAETAWKFLKYIVSEEGQQVMGKTGSGVPVLKSLLNDSSAEWRNFISADLNHNAFVAHPERDLAMNYVHGFTTAKQLTVYKELKDNFIYSMFNTNDRDAEFAAFKSKVDKLLGK